MDNPALDTLRRIRAQTIGKPASNPLSLGSRSPSSHPSSVFSSTDSRMETIPESSKSDLSIPSEKMRPQEDSSCNANKEHPAELSSDPIPIALSPPPAPPLPSTITATHSTSDPATAKARTLSSSSENSNGTHTCPNGIKYPSLDELLKFGRVSNSQLREVETNFCSDDFHCLSHLICEGIYHSSDKTHSKSPVVEDYVPLARNEFSLNLLTVVENAVRTRQSLTSSTNIDDQSSPSDNRQTKRRQWKTPPPESSLPNRHRSTTSSQSGSKRSIPFSNLSADSMSEDDIPFLQTRNSLFSSSSSPRPFPEDDISIPTHSDRTTRISVDFITNTDDAIIDLHQKCSLPLLFPNVRLSFLHYLHQSLYSLHLLNHVKVQSYPKSDLLDLLIVGRELCDTRRHRKNSIKNIEFFGIFLKQTLSTRKRRIRANPFAVPTLMKDISVSSELILQAFDGLHSEYKVAWNSHFKLMITPPFI